MTIILDDIIFESEEKFFLFIDDFFPDEHVKNLDNFYEVLSESKDAIEIILNDVEDIKDEHMKFARKVFEVVYDVRSVKKNYKVTRM